MHILILNQTFHPDVAATAQHMWDLSRYLVAKGHRVSALTSRRIYGTHRLAGAEREIVEGVEIFRVGGTSFGKRGLMSRVLDFGSFYVAAALKLRSIETPDVVIALTTPPMIAALGALWTRWSEGRRNRRSRFVYYVMDVYPDAAVASGVFSQGGLINRLFRRLTRATLKTADAIIALGRDMDELLRSRYLTYVPLAKRIHVVRPWADGDELHPLAKDANPLLAAWNVRDTFNVVYSGNFGIAHDLQTILGAIRVTANDANMRWLFIGSGKRFNELERCVESETLANVTMLPYQDRALINQSLNIADVHLVSQLPAFTGIVVPSKLFGIMAVGKPAIMVGPAECECARIIAEHGIGYVVPNGDVDALVQRIRQLQRDAQQCQSFGIQARQVFETHFQASIACQQIEQILLTLQ